MVTRRGAEAAIPMRYKGTGILKENRDPREGQKDPLRGPDSPKAPARSRQSTRDFMAGHWWRVGLASKLYTSHKDFPKPVITSCILKCAVEVFFGL